jgi:hypothetical protein
MVTADLSKPDENANLSANLELANDAPVKPTFSPFVLLPPAVFDLV